MSPDGGDLAGASSPDPSPTRSLADLAAAHHRSWDGEREGAAALPDDDPVDPTGDLIALIESGLPATHVVAEMVKHSRGDDDRYLAYVAATVVEHLVHEAVHDANLAIALELEASRQETWRVMLMMVWISKIDTRRLPAGLRAMLPSYARRSVEREARSRRRAIRRGDCVQPRE